ncbi:MAG: peroxiredoxin [Planctomycetota bacterium]
MLKAGDAIPDVEIPATPGLCDDATPLAVLASRAPLLLYSYPADGTPMCTRQACMMRDGVAEHAEALASTGLRVAGISPQGRASHDRFAGRHDLGFPIIADEDKSILRALGMLGPLGIPRRVTYLLGTSGTIVDATRADLLLGRHKAFLSRALARLEGRGEPAAGR